MAEFACQFQCELFLFSPIPTDDGVELFHAVSHHKFPRALPLAVITSVDEAEYWCKNRVKEWHSGECFVWTCRRLGEEKTIGQVTLLPQSGGLALAYWVNPKSWGQGLATHMCQSLISHLGQSGYKGQIKAGVHDWNLRSESVLCKLGFTQKSVSDSPDTKTFTLFVNSLE
ncbi:GNAT family N-acetyltransferase [Veronia pacifica]|uniref:GNAT family N-acetyltransferase n=1 Tax=Veronia pacifica TaxID=1080227 RepID=UPI001FE1FE5E|nr:GNAT family N-acetyltransferase [Veronia pacifica]